MIIVKLNYTQFCKIFNDKQNTIFCIGHIKKFYVGECMNTVNRSFNVRINHGQSLDSRLH